MPERTRFEREINVEYDHGVGRSRFKRLVDADFSGVSRALQQHTTSLTLKVVEGWIELSMPGWKWRSATVRGCLLALAEQFDAGSLQEQGAVPEAASSDVLGAFLLANSGEVSFSMAGELVVAVYMQPLPFRTVKHDVTYKVWRKAVRRARGSELIDVLESLPTSTEELVEGMMLT